MALLYQPLLRHYLEAGQHLIVGPLLTGNAQGTIEITYKNQSMSLPSTPFFDLFAVILEDKLVQTRSACPS
jgi:hypothetical protein